MMSMSCIFFFIFLCVHDRYVEGGMGSVSAAISKAAKEAGAYIVTRAEVYFLKYVSPFCILREKLV